MERILQAAREGSCFLEVNAQPDRLDLDDSCFRLAGEMGVKVAIASDAHDAAHLYMRFGVDSGPARLA